MSPKIGTPNVSVFNARKVVYLNGADKEEGSRRLSIDKNKNIPAVEKYVDGIWQPSSFKTGPKSVWVGERVAIAAAGHHIMTEDVDGHFHLHSHAKFDGKLSTSDARIIYAYQFIERNVLQPDNTGTFLGTSFDFSLIGSTHALVNVAYFQTDTTAASKPIRLRAWEGTDDTGPLIFDQTYPTSTFPALTEVKDSTDGYVEFGAGKNYYLRLSSDENFSLKTNAGGTLPWLAVDESLVHEDDMLQTTEWLSGDTFTVGQLSIQNRTVYSCNTAGVQTGTFNSNIALWDIAWQSLYEDLNMNDNDIKNVGAIDFDLDHTPTLISEGKIWWNGVEHTLNISTGLGPVIQVGQETLLLYYNDTGLVIPNFSVLHPKSATVVSGLVVPTPDLADASKWELSEGTISVATQEIGIGELGFAVRFGRARSGDTSGFTPGSQLWLSTTPGEMTNTRPEFPNYQISLGGALNSEVAPNGEIIVSVTRSELDTFNDTWDGSCRETFKFTITSTSSVITGTLTNKDFPTSDLTLIFSDGFYTFDVTPGAPITLTAGTDTVPQENFIYIPKSTKVLTVSTSEFPENIEHVKIAHIYLQSALSTQTETGALVNQNVNDHIKKFGDNGHLLHISQRLRALIAEWDTGAETSLNGTPSNVYISNTSGKVYQLHLQDFPAQDMATGDNIHVVNDSVTPYRATANLNDLTLDSTGTTLNNKYFSIVVWGVCNSQGEISHLMCNLPSGSYNVSEEQAISDANGYSNYTIPKPFKGTGFLMARFTMRKSSSNFTYSSLTGYQDLRGFVPNTTAGSGAGNSGITTFTGLTDTPSSYTSQALKIPQVNAGETALEFTSNLGNGITATTQSALDNSTKIATTAYVDGAVSVEDLWNRTGTTLSPKTASDDVLADCIGSTISNPRILGLSGMGNVGTAARVQIGDDKHGIQAGWGQAMSMYAYHSITLAGGRGTSGLPISGNTGFSATILGTLPNSPVFEVRGAASQVSDLQQWRDSAGTVLASVDKDGGLSASGILINDGNRNRIFTSILSTEIISPNGLHHIKVADTEALITANPSFLKLESMALTYKDDGLTARFVIDSTSFRGMSPDKTKILAIDNTGTNITGNLKFTAVDSKIYSSDEKGYLEFAIAGELNWYDVDNAIWRIHINGDGNYQFAPAGFNSIQLTDSGLDLNANDFKVYDGTNNRLATTTSSTYMKSPDGNRVLDIDNDGLTTNAPELEVPTTFSILSGSNRLFIDALNTQLLSPDGNKDVVVSNTGIALTGDTTVTGAISLSGDVTRTGATVFKITTPEAGFELYDGTRNRIVVNTGTTNLISPNGLYTVACDSNDIQFHDGVRSRMNVDSFDSLMASPDGTNTVSVNNTNTAIVGPVDINGGVDISDGLIVGSNGSFPTPNNPARLTLSRWAGDFASTGIIFQGGGNGVGGFYPDFLMDSFFGGIRLGGSSAGNLIFGMNNGGIGDFYLGVGVNPTVSLDIFSKAGSSKFQVAGNAAGYPYISVGGTSTVVSAVIGKTQPASDL